MTEHYKSKLICLLVVLFMVSCGGQLTVDINHVNQSTIDAMCDESYRCKAYATWDGLGNCQIYIKERTEYTNDEEYHRLLGHELRHCFEENFH